MKTKITKLAIAIFMAQGIAVTANAQGVPISPLISVGKTEVYSEAEPNVWFVLDSSGSMKYNTTYDPSVTYVKPPVYNASTKEFESQSQGNSSNQGIFNDYYRTKMMTLKSSLELVLFDPKYSNLTNRIRVGYRDFTSARWNPNGNKYLLPVQPFYGANRQVNRLNTYQWLHYINAKNNTPLRGATAQTINEISTHSKTKTSDNPFLVKPGEAYHATDNPTLSCRRNYMLVLTDGEWNGGISVPSAVAATRVNNGYTLPDGTDYVPMAPYKHNLSMRTCDYTNTWHCGGYVGTTEIPTMADLAFDAWRKDLDGDTTNNDLEVKNASVDSAVPELNGSAYWHPYNDPASWQHIQTYTIGFKLAGLTTPAIDYTKPLSATYTNSNFAWNPRITKRTYSTRPSWHSSYDISSYNGGSSQDMVNAAFAGRGHYYDVRSPQDMIDAFSDFLYEASKPAEKPATAGSSGTAGNSQKLDNSFFATRYDGDSFTGELIKSNLYSGNPNDATSCGVPTTANPGTACPTAVWNAAKKLTPSAWNSRKIITSKRKQNGKYKVVNFTVNNLSADDKTILKNAFPDVLKNNISGESAQFEALFNYVKGDGSHEPTFRNRNKHKFENAPEGRNILGAIMRSSPIYAGVPSSATGHFSQSGSAYTNYVNYVKNFTDHNTTGQKEVVYVGSNDGMLHAFKANTGKELFAYVPNAVFSRLPETVVPKRSLSLVNGNIVYEDVNFGSNTTTDDNNSHWQRVLAGTMAGGAKGLYALNITATGGNTPSIATIKGKSKGNWEFGARDSNNIGNIFAAPGITQLADNTWAAIVGNGYNSNSNKATLIVINLETGELIQELVLDTANKFSDATAPNGLGPVTFAGYPDKDKKDQGKFDRAYAGDLQGNMWVFDLTHSSKSGGITVDNNKPIFTAKDSNNKRQPITVAPTVLEHPYGYGMLIHFGTGALFAIDDLSSKVGNSIYAIWDDWADKGALKTPRTTAVTKSQLNNVALGYTEFTSGSTLVKVRYVSSSNRKTSWKLGGYGTDRGWKTDLLSAERAWQPAEIVYGANNTTAIGYNTVIYSGSNSNGGNNTGAQTTCVSGATAVESWQLLFNPNDAARYLKGFGAADVDGDGRITEYDLVTVPGSTKKVPVTGVGTQGEVKFNSVNQKINKKKTPPCDPADPSCKPPTDGGNLCYFNRASSSSTNGLGSSVITQHCAYFSSWKELK